MDIEDVFTKIGGYGSSQKKILYILSLCHVYLCFDVLILTFIGAEPPWSCRPAEPKNQAQDDCVSFERGECSPIYSLEFSSIVSEWDLVCSNASWINMSQSVFFIGWLIGSWLWGTIADKIGRKKVYFINIACIILSGLGFGFAPSYTVFVFFRLLNAASCAGISISSYVLSVEVVGISSRSFAGFLGAIFFSLAYPVLAILAYFIRSWRWLSVVISLLGLGYFPLWRSIPESPRWLLVSGNEQEAISVLTSIANGNGTEMPTNCELRKPLMNSPRQKSISILQLFGGKNIRHRTLTMLLVWFVTCMVYYAMAMSAGSVGGDRYVSFSLSGLVEVPSLVVGYFIVDRLGRRWTLGGFLLVGGTSCLIWTQLQIHADSAALNRLALAVVLTGKFAVAGAFASVYLYTVELLPTQVRNIGMGAMSIGARLGGILAPMVLLLASYSEGVPMLLMGGLATGAGLLSLTLPETLNQPMPETLNDLD